MDFECETYKITIVGVEYLLTYVRCTDISVSIKVGIVGKYRYTGDR